MSDSFDENNKKSTWKEFRESGFLWLVNTILHAFGWVIVLTIDEKGDYIAYPYKTKWRGFSQSSNDRGYKNISYYMRDHMDEIMEPFNEENNKEGE